AGTDRLAAMLTTTAWRRPGLHVASHDAIETEARQPPQRKHLEAPANAKAAPHGDVSVDARAKVACHPPSVPPKRPNPARRGSHAERSAVSPSCHPPSGRT